MNRDANVLFNSQKYRREQLVRSCNASDPLAASVLSPRERSCRVDRVNSINLFVTNTESD